MEKTDKSFGIILYKIEKNITKYLFLKRSGGWLDFPKGHMEDKETEIQAALRETREETGVELNINDLDKKYRYNLDYVFIFNGMKIFKRVKMFLARINSETEIKVSWEHTGYVWLDYESAYDKLKFQNQKDMLKNVNIYLKTIVK